ncbi:MAG: response regulator [Reichenbachiella sp.]
MEKIRFQHLTTQDGLSQNMVDCMLQDASGFVWLGTWNGLCKYDGYEFEVFNDQNPGDQYLGNNFIYSLYQDQFANLWIGTKEGLFIFLNEKKRIVQIIDESNGLSKFDSYFVLSGHESGALLVGSNRGLISLRIQNKTGVFDVEKFIPLHPSSKLQGTRVQAITQTTDQSLWIGTDQRLYKYNTNLELKRKYHFDPTDFNSLSSNVILNILELSSGEIWVGTEVGLNQYNPSADNFNRFYNDPANLSSLIHNTIMDMIEGEKGELIIATLGGISIRYPDELSFSNYTSEPENKDGLNNDFLNCLLIDNDSNLWVGTERGGLNVVNANSSYFDGLSHEVGNKNSLNSNTINSIFEDEKYLWIGTAGGGLNRLHKKNEKMTHFTTEVSNPSTISSDFITTMLKDSRGVLWVGTWGVGLNRLYDLDTESKQAFGRVTAENSGLTSNFISSIVEDENGRIWIGTLHGLVVFNPDSGRFVDYFSDQGYEINKGVGCLVLSQNHKLWVGTRDGLFRIDINDPTKDVLSFYHDPSLPGTISNNYIISLIEDHKGNIWCGTYGQGLNKISKERDEFVISSFTTSKNRLSNNIIYGIIEDNNYKLWLSTDYGLTRFDPETELSRNFFKSEGLRNNQFYWGAYFKNESGKLYFGGMNGLDSFYPEWISEDINNPTVRITDINLLNKSIIPNKSYNGIIVTKDAIINSTEIQLSYKEQIVTFEYSSFHFMDSDLISYAYKLEGFDKQWNQAAPGRRSATYNNLKPGKYKFLVKASGHDGRFSQESAAISITVLPPFWETLWFRVLSILLGIAAVVGYLRYRLYALKKQKTDLENQVKLRTQEINRQKEAISKQAEQLKHSNEDLAAKQELIEGQNRQLEKNNAEISSKRDELIQLNEKLNLVSQLRLSFFTNISHEFRTPLTLIIGPMERLLNHFNLNGEVKDNLHVINRNAKRLLHLINEIMDFRKIEKGEVGLTISKMRVDELSQSTFEVFKPLAEIKDVTLQYHQLGEGFELCLDEKKVENILYNLLSNAIKYTPAGGFVRFELSRVAYLDSLLNVKESLTDQTPVVSFKIIDSGQGISEENLPLIFKRFFRIESEKAFNIEGSGIGLAITEELIKAHEGQIHVSSELGHGSVFEVQLPGLEKHVSTQADQTEPSISINIQDQLEVLKNELLVKGADPIEEEQVEIDDTRDTVLIVEDNLDLRKFVADRLSEKYNVILAQDGEFGESLAIEYSPNLIVSDIMMPKKNGLELCAAIKTNFVTSHIPVILLTAKSSVENQIAGLETGADDYLSKPFSFEVLEARIINLLESRRQLKKRFGQQDDLPLAELTGNKKDEAFLKKAIQTVKENMNNSDFGIQNIVRSLGVSRSLLHTKLTALVGQSTTEFVNSLKIKEAKQMLREGQLTISEVAYATGYNDPKYFSRLFSKQTGQSPKRYQEEQNSRSF